MKISVNRTFYFHFEFLNNLNNFRENSIYKIKPWAQNAYANFLLNLPTTVFILVFKVLVFKDSSLNKS